jgi:hypothetical protein
MEIYRDLGRQTPEKYFCPIRTFIVSSRIEKNVTTVYLYLVHSRGLSLAMLRAHVKYIFQKLPGPAPPRDMWDLKSPAGDFIMEMGERREEKTTYLYRLVSAFPSSLHSNWLCSTAYGSADLLATAGPQPPSHGKVQPSNSRLTAFHARPPSHYV